MDEKQARADICTIGKLLYDKGMIAGFEGNISCRLGSDQVLITPAGKCKGALEAHDVVSISLEGETSGNGEPSSEYRLHLAAYRRRGDFRAAVHAHAPHLSAFALRGEPLNTASLIPEFAATFGSVPLVPFAPPGSAELGEKLAEVAETAHTFLLERHGAVAFGADLWEAFYRLEMAEQLAKTVILAHSITTPGATK